MRTYGASVTPSPSMETEVGRKILAEHPGTSGSLGCAISEAVEVALGSEGYRYVLGSVLNQVALHQSIIGMETKLALDKYGVTPDIIYPSFSDTMDIGEEKLPHAMAWDTIQPLNYNVFDPGLSNLIPVLRERSERRIQNNPEFTMLRKDIEAFRKIRDRKTISLNLKKRWQEYLAEKKLHDEQEKLMRLDMDAVPDASKKEIKDLYLDETLNVVADYISLNGRPAGAMATVTAQ